MPNPDLKRQPIAEALEFRPRLWWDPVPPWLMEQLRPDVIRDLAVIQMELSKTVLEAQLKATDRALAVIQKVK